MDIVSLIQKQVSIKGSLSFSKPLFFDGQIDGDLETTGSLTIGENGRVKGNVHAKDLIVWGSVFGNMFVEQSCSIEKDASVNGDIQARVLRMEEGATLNGMADIDPSRVAKEPKKAPDTPKKEPVKAVESPKAVAEVAASKA